MYLVCNEFIVGSFVIRPKIPDYSLNISIDNSEKYKALCKLYILCKCSPHYKQIVKKYLCVCVSDGNMDDQELNEPQNRVALLKGKYGSSSVLCSSALCCTNINQGQVTYLTCNTVN